MSDLSLRYPAAVTAGPGVVGGKGWNLARLHRYGCPVPAGGVLAAEAYRRFLARPELTAAIRRLPLESAERADSPELAAALANLRAAIQAYVITFDSGAPRPSAGQEAVVDAVANDLSELIRVARGLGFSVRVMIVGHADATGRETSNLALSAARAEVVRHMLRVRGIAPDLLAVRSAGTLEPLEGRVTTQDDPMNRRVIFSVSTAD